MVDKLWTINYSDERLAYLSQQVHNDTRAFSGAQLASLMPPLIFAVDMVQVELPHIPLIRSSPIIPRVHNTDTHPSSSSSSSSASMIERR